MSDQNKIPEGEVPVPKYNKSLVQSSIWFLSYLCESGYIKNEDDIWSDYVCGPLLKHFMGLPPGTYCHITNDGKNYHRFHIYYIDGTLYNRLYEERIQEDEYYAYNIREWPEVRMKKFNVGIMNCDEIGDMDAL